MDSYRQLLSAGKIYTFPIFMATMWNGDLSMGCNLMVLYVLNVTLSETSPMYSKVVGYALCSTSLECITDTGLTFPYRELDLIRSDFLSPMFADCKQIPSIDWNMSKILNSIRMQHEHRSLIFIGESLIMSDLIFSFPHLLIAGCNVNGTSKSESGKRQK